MSKLIDNKGFTLIELIIILAIIGIISVMAIPSIINIQQKNIEKEYIQDAKDFLIAAQRQELTDSYVAQNIIYSCTTNGVAEGGISLFEIVGSGVTKSPEGFDYIGTIAKKDGIYYVCLTERDKSGESGKRTVVATSTELYDDNAASYVIDKLSASSDCNITNISGTALSKKICP